MTIHGMYPSLNGVARQPAIGEARQGGGSIVGSMMTGVLDEGIISQLNNGLLQQWDGRGGAFKEQGGSEHASMHSKCTIYLFVPHCEQVGEEGASARGRGGGLEPLATATLARNPVCWDEIMNVSEYHTHSASTHTHTPPHTSEEPQVLLSSL